MVRSRFRRASVRKMHSHKHTPYRHLVKGQLSLSGPLGVSVFAGQRLLGGSWDTRTAWKQGYTSFHPKPSKAKSEALHLMLSRRGYDIAKHSQHAW